MPKFQSVRSGVNTEVPLTEKPVGAWDRLVNGVTSNEGVVPLRAMLRPVGNTFTLATLNMSTVYAIKVYTYSKNRAIISVFSNNVLQPSRDLYLFSVSTDLTKDNHPLLGVTLTSTDLTAVNAGVTVTSVVGSAVSKSFSDALFQRFLHYRSEVLCSTCTVWGDDVGELPRPSTTFGQGFPTSTIYRINTSATPLTPLQDVKLTTTQAPATPFIVNLGEYICAVAGGRGVATPPAAASPTADETNRYYFRWASPDTVDEWQPDLVNIPPQWFSGALLLPSLGDVVDVFAAYSRVYVVQELGVVECTKVGGAVGFTQRTLNVTFNLTAPAIGRCVPTSKGVFYINSDGLYVFDGMSSTHLATEAESVFTSEWWRETFNTHFNTHPVSEQPPRVGVHIPAVDSVIWYMYSNPTVTLLRDAAVTSAVPTPRLLGVIYNYELGTVSTLESPVGKLWGLVEGQYPGIVEYDTVSRNIQLFAITKNLQQPLSYIPQVNIDWRSGMYSTTDADTTLMVTRLFLQYTGLGLGSAIVTLYLYDDDRATAPRTVQVGQVTTFTTHKWRDIRGDGRFVQIGISGVVSEDVFTKLQGVGVMATPTGTRW